MNFFNLDIFEDIENDFFQRFSSILLFIYLYYSLSYYFLLDDQINKPHIIYILILLIFHLIHIILLKILHNNNLISYSWIFAMIPLIIYLFYTKYMERILLNKQKIKEEMFIQIKKEMQNKQLNFLRNVNSQMPNQPPQYPQQHQPQQHHQQQPPQYQQNQPNQPNQQNMVRHLDNSRNLENLQQNRGAIMQLNQQKNPNQLSAQPIQQMGVDPYFQNNNY
jgi:hypothetical protein